MDGRRRRRRRRARRDAGRGRPVHPLHVGVDREAEGRPPHDGRLSHLCGVHAPERLRLAAVRRLLVHRRRRLGDGPLVRRLRTARERGDDRHVRRRAHVAGRGTFLGRRRPPRRHDLLHRADRDPRAAGRGRRAGEEAEPQVAPAARVGRRADQSRGLALVLAHRRRRALPDRRHVVADRDGRDPDLASAGRDAAKAGIGDAAPPRDPPGPPRRPGHAAHGKRGRREPRHRVPVARDDANGLRQPRAVPRDLLLEVPRRVLHRRRLLPRPGRLLLDHRTCRRRAERLRASDRHRRGRERARDARRRRRGRGRRHAAQDQGPGDLRLRAAQGGRDAAARARAGARPGRAPPDRRVRGARRDPRRPGLPKTRSGKIMRRILRKLAEGETSELGDITTLADPGVVDALLKTRPDSGSA